MSNTNTLAAMPTYNNTGELLASELHALMPLLQNNILQDHRRSYPETKFKQYFAPFFLGVYEVPPQYNLLTMWVSEIGSQHVEVDVIDPVGNILFTVPPILNTNGINIGINAVHPHRFKNLENLHQAESHNNPSGATVDYYNGVAHKLGSLFEGFSADPSHTDKWLKIYAFYNITPPVPDNVTIRPNAPQSNTYANSGWVDPSELNFNPTFD